MESIELSASHSWKLVSDLIASGELEKATEICKQTPYSDLVESQRFLGWTYYSKGEATEALTWFSKAASHGDGEALFGIGSVYVAQKDFLNALPYFDRSVNCGYGRGFQWIAGIHEHGCGVPADINMAVSYYKKGAAHGYVMAERSLINIELKNGNIAERVLATLKLIWLQVRTARLAYKNINDPRLADVKKWK